MRVLRKRILLIFCASLLVTVSCVLNITILQPKYPNMSAVLLPVLFSILILLLVVLSFSYKKHSTARVIIENEIIHVHPIKLDMDETFDNMDNLEISISSFGILIGPKIIKFNQDYIRLKTVEIRQNTLFLEFGSDAKLQSIKLLLPPLSQSERDRISKMFLRDTGVAMNYSD